jgi:hypothetical protein
MTSLEAHFHRAHLWNERRSSSRVEVGFSTFSRRVAPGGIREHLGTFSLADALGVEFCRMVFKGGFTAGSEAP